MLDGGLFEKTAVVYETEALAFRQWVVSPIPRLKARTCYTFFTPQRPRLSGKGAADVGVSDGRGIGLL